MVDTVLINQLLNVSGNHSQALGDLIKNASAAHNAMGGLTNMLGTFNSLVLGGAIALGVGHLKDLNKELEDAKYRLAGSLGAAGFAKNFADNMLLARVAMTQIRREAAKLPGTEGDFMQGFAMTMPALKEAGMTNLSKMVSVSDNLIAIAKSQGIDSQQAGRDVMMMARGHAGSDVRTFEALKSAMGVKDSQEFNKLSGEKRLAAFDKAIKAYAGLLDNFDNTWEAISSTAESYAKTLLITFTGPLFEKAKSAIGWLNSQFGSMQDRILLLAEYVGTRIAGALGTAVDIAGRMITTPTAAAGPTGVMPALWTTFDLLLSALAPLQSMFITAKEAVLMLGSAIGELVLPILPPFAYFIGLLTQVFGLFWNATMKVITILAAVLAPAFAVLGGALSLGFKVVIDVLMWFFLVLRDGISTIANKLAPAIDLVLTGAKRLADYLAELFRWAGKQWEATGPLAGKPGVGYGDAASAWMREKLKMFDFAEQKKKQEELDKQRAAQLAADMKKAKPQVTVNNTFNINQQFDRDMDIDRIVPAMQRDANSLAGRRTQSAFGFWKPL